MATYNSLRTFLCFFCIVIRFNNSFRLASSGNNKSAQFTVMHSSVKPMMNTQPDQTIFGKTTSCQRSIPFYLLTYKFSKLDDVSLNLETSTFVPGPFSGMERVALSANGNLQRILSAYYGAPINVKIKRCVEMGNNTFDREVDLLVHGKVVCTAVGQISIYSEECLRAIRDQKVGVGQLFRHFKTTPSFRLLRAGRRLVGVHDMDGGRGNCAYSLDESGDTDSRDASRKVDSVLSDYGSQTHSAQSGGETADSSGDCYSIWREYELYNQHMHCRFVERFTPGFLSLGPK